MVTRSALALALLASFCVVGDADAQEAKFKIDVPAGAVADALATLSAQTGISIGYDGFPDGARSAKVRGRLSVDQALAVMLAPTRFVARRVGLATWRLESRQPRRLSGALAAPPPIADIVVTARKLAETLSRSPAPIAVYVPAAVGRGGGVRVGARDVSREIEGLSLTNLGPGRDRPFIRGIADSPFNGFSQSTVSVNIDEARVTYDAPEPGLRLVDVARVEVLKGPQGPLYGTGALGGVYRIVTNRPVLGDLQAAASAGFGGTAGGGPGADAQAVVNLPLMGNAAAIRLVGYGIADDGWIDDAGRQQRDINSTLLYGARAALRVVPASGWSIDLGGAYQRVATRDSQYVDRDSEDLTRTARIPEPSSSLFRLVHSTVEGPVGDLRLTVATSHAWQDRSETYDATTAAAVLGVPGVQAYRDRRAHRVLDQEVRIGSVQGRKFTWTAGGSYLSATTRADGEVAGRARSYRPFFALHRGVTEAALFADGSIALAPRLRGGLGARLFRATTDDELREDEAVAGASARTIYGITPSASLAYEIAPDRMIYARFGSAFRPGGLDQSNARTGRYEADEVRSFDLGTRLALDGGRLSFSAGVFRSTWMHLQSDYLQVDGLVGTRTAGDASILGAEASAEWHLDSWILKMGASWQHARLERAADGSDLPDDRRLPVTPEYTGRASFGRSQSVFGRPSYLQFTGNYVGPSRLSFDDGLDRRMGGYAIVGAAAAMTLGELDVRLEADNLLNARADTFAFGNPFRVRSERQYTPLRPRSLRIVLAHDF